MVLLVSQDKFPCYSDEHTSRTDLLILLALFPAIVHQSRTLGQRLGLTEQIIKVHVAELVLLENPVDLVLVFADLRILRKKQSSEQQHEETSISPSIPRSCRDLFALLRCHQHRPTATSGFPVAMTAHSSEASDGLQSHLLVEATTVVGIDCFP